MSNSRVHELNLCMWAAEPDHERGMAFDSYFHIYQHLEELRGGPGGITAYVHPPFYGEPPETAISCCRGLLQAGSQDDAASQVALCVTNRLAVTCLRDFAQAGMHSEVVNTLWKRLKVSPQGEYIWSLSSTTMIYFGYVTFSLTLMSIL